MKLNEPIEKVIDVNTGEVKVGKVDVVLRSIAIGSCIVIAAYDGRNKTGGMAHIMLPGEAPEKESEKTKYAYNAVEMLINLMIQKGSKIEDIEVCLVGGGNVLKKKRDSICKDNIDSTTALLAEKQIPVRKTVLGGTTRKGIFLDVENGIFTYTEGNGPEKLLWKSVSEKD